MVVMSDVVVVMWVVLLWGCWSTGLLLSVSLSSLHEVKLVVPLALFTIYLRSRSRRESLPVWIRSSVGMTPGFVIHPFAAFNAPLALT